jgi:SWI/SNF-related matrix-associated actin-dependent regulator of chromatin subfamily A member 5
MDTLANASKRPFDTLSASSSVGTGDELVDTKPSTASTSIVATPAAASPPALSRQVAKKLKVARFAGSSNGGMPAADKAELDKRRDQFLRAHSKVYLAVLPEANNAVAKLMKGSAGRTFKDAVPYEKLEQPSLIRGGAMMKEYQLAGLSFMAYMFENGMNCILADE